MCLCLRNSIVRDPELQEDEEDDSDGSSVDMEEEAIAKRKGVHAAILGPHPSFQPHEACMHLKSPSLARSSCWICLVLLDPCESSQPVLCFSGSHMHL